MRPCSPLASHAPSSAPSRAMATASVQCAERRSPSRSRIRRSRRFACSSSLTSPPVPRRVTRLDQPSPSAGMTRPPSLARARPGCARDQTTALRIALPRCEALSSSTSGGDAMLDGSRGVMPAPVASTRRRSAFAGFVVARRTDSVMREALPLSRGVVARRALRPSPRPPSSLEGGDDPGYGGHPRAPGKGAPPLRAPLPSNGGAIAARQRTPELLAPAEFAL